MKVTLSEFVRAIVVDVVHGVYKFNADVSPDYKAVAFIPQSIEIEAFVDELGFVTEHGKSKIKLQVPLNPVAGKDATTVGWKIEQPQDN